VEESAGAVPIAPIVDVGPVDVLALNGDDIAHVLAILGALRRQRPAQFRDNHVPDSGYVDLAAHRFYPPTTAKALLIVRVVAEMEQFDSGSGAQDLQNMTAGQGGCLKCHLGVEMEGRVKMIREMRERFGAKLDHEIHILC